MLFQPMADLSPSNEGVEHYGAEGEGLFLNGPTEGRDDENHGCKSYAKGLVESIVCRPKRLMSGRFHDLDGGDDACAPGLRGACAPA